MMSQPLGPEVDNPTATSIPTRLTLKGCWVTLKPLTAEHEPSLNSCLNQPSQASLRTYLPTVAPFSTREVFQAHIEEKAASADPMFWAIIRNDEKGEAEGHVALMRIDRGNRVLEIGHVLFSERLQRTPPATESLYLLLHYAFTTLHYRRLEWKCNDLNKASKRAALPLGFSYEGTIRQHMIVKGRNRDSAWFSMLDGEWEGGRKGALERWLSEGNFDEGGRQRGRLEYFRVEGREGDGCS